MPQNETELHTTTYSTQKKLLDEASRLFNGREKPHRIKGAGNQIDLDLPRGLDKMQIRKSDGSVLSFSGYKEGKDTFEEWIKKGGFDSAEIKKLMLLQKVFNQGFRCLDRWIFTDLYPSLSADDEHIAFKPDGELQKFEVTITQDGLQLEVSNTLLPLMSSPTSGLLSKEIKLGESSVKFKIIQNNDANENGKIEIQAWDTTDKRYHKLITTPNLNHDYMAKYEFYKDCVEDLVDLSDSGKKEYRDAVRAFAEQNGLMVLPQDFIDEYNDEILVHSSLNAPSTFTIDLLRNNPTAGTTPFQDYISQLSQAKFEQLFERAGISEPDRTSILEKCEGKTNREKYQWLFRTQTNFDTALNGFADKKDNVLRLVGKEWLKDSLEIDDTTSENYINAYNQQLISLPDQCKSRFLGPDLTLKLKTELFNINLGLDYSSNTSVTFRKNGELGFLLKPSFTDLTKPIKDSNGISTGECETFCDSGTTVSLTYKLGEVTTGETKKTAYRLSEVVCNDPLEVRLMQNNPKVEESEVPAILLQQLARGLSTTNKSIFEKITILTERAKKIGASDSDVFNAVGISAKTLWNEFEKEYRAMLPESRFALAGFLNQFSSMVGKNRAFSDEQKVLHAMQYIRNPDAKDKSVKIALHKGYYNLRKSQIQEELKNSRISDWKKRDYVNELIALHNSLKLPGNVDLSHLDLSRASLCGLDLSGTNLEGVKLSAARLDGVTFPPLIVCKDAKTYKGILNFQNADISKIVFKDMKIFEKMKPGAFENAKLNDKQVRQILATGHGRLLKGADLSGIDLNRLNFSGADLRETNLSGANLSGAIFTQNENDKPKAAVFDAKTKIDGAKFNEKTLLPNNHGLVLTENQKKQLPQPSNARRLERLHAAAPQPTKSHETTTPISSPRSPREEGTPTSAEKRTSPTSSAGSSSFRVVDTRKPTSPQKSPTSSSTTPPLVDFGSRGDTEAAVVPTRKGTPTSPASSTAAFFPVQKKLDFVTWLVNHKDGEAIFNELKKAIGDGSVKAANLNKHCPALNSDGIKSATDLTRKFSNDLKTIGDAIRDHDNFNALKAASNESKPMTPRS